jgi:epoxyqueuosine reductase
LPLSFDHFPTWLTAWMHAQGIALWGAADFEGFSTPLDRVGQGFPRALAWAIPLQPWIMAGIQAGPTQAYADEYARVNQRLNEVAAGLAREIKSRGYRAQPLAASERTDAANIRGDFPHKTAATRAGLGWVGRHCQLVTYKFGPWVRLGTVFTDLDLSCGPAMRRPFCGRCSRCVDACPAGALSGAHWHPGLPREAILDVRACDAWKKEHYLQFHQGHNCGICAAVCPYGLKVLKGNPAPSPDL